MSFKDKIDSLLEETIREMLEESSVTDHESMAAKHRAHEDGHANQADREYNNRKHDDDRSHEDHEDAAGDHGSAYRAHQAAHAALIKYGRNSSQYKQAARIAHDATKRAKQSSSYAGKISSRYAPSKQHRL